MPTPSLRIPVGLNLDQLQKNVETAKGHTRQATQFILKQFADMNASLGGPAAAGMFAGYGASALRLVGIFGAVTTAIKLTGDAIVATRERMAEMVDVATKAQDRGLSAEFFQSFVSGAKGAEDKIEAFEAALTRAFQATKPILNPDWSVWDTGVTKVTAIEKAMRETRELFTTDQNFSGFDRFMNAQTQDDKIRAVLAYMLQLKAIGQDVAALDIGEKMFGATFADNIRLGKTSIEGIKKTIDEGSQSNFVSNEAAKNAKELDDRLNDAYYTLHEKFKPSWDDLASSALKIKGIWTDIIEAVAKFDGAAIGRLGHDVADETGFRTSGDESAGLNLSPRPDTSEVTPMPRRRPSDAPKPPPAAKVERDPFDVAIDSTDKRIAALKAETATIAESTAARERAKTVAQLEEAAKRANTAAGMANTAVTDKQRAAIEKEADAMLRASAAAEKARVGESIKFSADTSLLSSEDIAIATQLKGLYPDVATALNSVEASAMRVNDAMKTVSSSIQGSVTSALTDMMGNSRTAGQSFYNMGRSIVRSLDEMVIKMLVVAPIMRALQSSMGGLNLFGSATTPAAQFAGGTIPMADGGFISGPGSSRSDSIPARLSNGEFVINAHATSQNRALLEAINGGHLRGFADGGLASNVPSLPASTMIGGQTTHISPTINVTVQGQPGASARDHAEMGQAIAKAAEQQMRSIVANEIRTQSRPGGILRK
jgi:hypothetical protein